MKIPAYYDNHVLAKLRDFVDGNDRVERAFETIERWGVTKPKRILEIGCGIGHVCWRMSQRWPLAEVIGLDISPKSVEIARRLFGSSKLTFVEGPLVKGVLAGEFDLILLMDVYEHIAVGDRRALHEALRELRAADGRIVLSVPTPRHLAWLRQHHPDQIQPVDEDIGVEALLDLGRDTGTRILLYQEVGVWHQGDYAHAVLGNQTRWVAIAERPRVIHGIKSGIRQLMLGRGNPNTVSRNQKRALVRRRLGREFYRD
jgi:SAM-dependent methyltransferase